MKQYVELRLSVLCTTIRDNGSSSNISRQWFIVVIIARQAKCLNSSFSRPAMHCLRHESNLTYSKSTDSVENVFLSTARLECCSKETVVP